MNIINQLFREGYEYRKLSVEEGQGIYRFVTLKPIVFSVDVVLPKVKFTCRGKVWMETGPYFYKCPAGYMWNGNSFKKGYRVCGVDVWVGVPDFKATRLASLSHDLPFQFSALPEMQIGFEEANNNYLLLCIQNEFFMTYTYYGAVKDFSRRYWGCDNPDNDAILILDK